MQVTGKGRIYHNKYGYSISDNQKQQNGEWVNYFIPVQFQKGLDIPENKADVLINGFTKPFKYKDEKIGISYFVTDWELQKKDEPLEKELDLEATFGTAVEIEVNEDDLPF